MKDIQQKTGDKESKLTTAETRVVSGQKILTLKSRTAAVSSLISGPETAIIDCEKISVPARRIISWSHTVAQDSRVILLTEEEEIPVDPITVDAWVTKPLSDEELKKVLDEFDCRDRYATALSEYEQCIRTRSGTGTETRQYELRQQLDEVRAELAAIDQSESGCAFERTMREILQREK